MVVLGFVGFVLMIVFGALALAAMVVGWVLFLPLRLLGFLFKGLGFVVALPVLAVLGLVAILVFGVGVVLAALPILPLLAVGALIWWAIGRGHRHAARV